MSEETKLITTTNRTSNSKMYLFLRLELQRVTIPPERARALFGNHMRISKDVDKLGHLMRHALLRQQDVLVRRCDSMHGPLMRFKRDEFNGVVIVSGKSLRKFREIHGSRLVLVDQMENIN